CAATVPTDRVEPRMYQGAETEPRVYKQPFVVHGRLNGRFARILIDTGCNTLVVSDRWVKRAGIPTTTASRDYNIMWGNRSGQHETTRLITADLSVQTEERTPYVEAAVP